VNRAKRGFAVLAVLGIGTAQVFVSPLVQTAAAVDPIPYQYVMKVFTESLGRGMASTDWAAQEAYFQSAGCSVSSLQAYGRLAMLSTEFNDLGYDNTSRVLVGYRTVLNREPDAAGFANAKAALDSGSLTWSQLVDLLYGSGEFASLKAAICSATSPDYDFGTSPAIDVPTVGTGFTGTQAQLQTLLNSTPSGGTVTLRARTVIRLSSALDVPAGVILVSASAPDARHYANMARLVRANTWPTFAGPAIKLQSGAKLRNVWVDGQLGDPNRYLASASNVLASSGTLTEVSNSRLSNTAGAYNVGSCGGGDALNPYCGPQVNCVGHLYAYNLIDSYSTDHSNAHWTDGLSIGCEDADIHHNTVVDASDVGIITFGQQGRTQISQVHDNTVINAGEGAFASLGISPYFQEPVGDGPGVWSRNFTGSVFSNNVFWNTDRSRNSIGIAVGVKPWSGALARNGSGQVVQGNNTGSAHLWAQNGIVVSGMLNVNVTNNFPFDMTVVTGQSTCPAAVIGAMVSAGYASGTIQGVWHDDTYSGCI
jgi:hypothetical protein